MHIDIYHIKHYFSRLKTFVKTVTCRPNCFNSDSNFIILLWQFFSLTVLCVTLASLCYMQALYKLFLGADDDDDIDNCFKLRVIVWQASSLQRLVTPPSQSASVAHGIKVIRLKVAIDRRLTVVDERSPAVLKYKTPHFRWTHKLSHITWSLWGGGYAGERRFRSDFQGETFS